MIITKEMLLSLSTKEMNQMGICRKYYGGSNIAEFRRDIKGLLSEYKVRRIQSIWIELRKEEILSLMERCTDPGQVAKELGISYYFLQVWGKECGIWPGSRNAGRDYSLLVR